MKRILIICIVFFAGCYTDNRIRTKPTLDYKIPPAQKEMLQLHVMREMWVQTQLRHYEKEKE